MTDSPTLNELGRQINALNQRLDRKVDEKVHDLAFQQLREDMAEVKAWQQRMTWALIGNFVGLIIALLTLLLDTGLP